ncbi:MULTISPECIES: hypothetical protein [Haematobacter]|uniref:Uncharacterized protein n=3 Tax=Haematobacter massiliensis TaxID=195105 RepID=A0A086Y8T9_9RHOB|nr:MULTISPECIES: hypothetical protein [Haematobacter]KFI30689.1 hypothetical protein CN97_12795 [Haematobacter massiliensis]OWJ87449.1 hypothetical protein CDV51_06895 [Haematobacter massiliensis]QBJ24902.1 hypothetical protein HmaOT1_12000 [Haematobacter massiliensis]
MAYVALFLALTPVVWILAQHLAAQSLYGELQTISKEAETTSPRISPEDIWNREAVSIARLSAAISLGSLIATALGLIALFKTLQSSREATNAALRAVEVQEL